MSGTKWGCRNDTLRSLYLTCIQGSSLIYPIKEIRICSHSQSSIHKLQGRPSLQDDTVGGTIWKQLIHLTNQLIHITFQWIPGHSDIEGNEKFKSVIAAVKREMKKKWIETAGEKQKQKQRNKFHTARLEKNTMTSTEKVNAFYLNSARENHLLQWITYKNLKPKIQINIKTVVMLKSIQQNT